MKNVPAHHGVDLRALAGRDREDAKKALNPARAAREAAAGGDAEHWTPPVLGTVAAKGEGIEGLIDALDRHYTYLEASGELRMRRRRRLRERVVETAEDRVRRRLWGDADTNAWIDAQLPELESGATTPFAVADALLARSGDLVTRTDR
jgi:LAO/AO transport system kinase